MSLIDTGDREMRFHDREKTSAIDLSGFEFEYYCPDETEILVLRSLLFFYSEQKITFGKLKEFFSPKAIKLFEKDGYIKFKNE